MPDLPLENYFGDGRDGVLDTAGDVLFPVEVDGPTVFKYYTSMRINAGHLVTPANRCKGMVIYCLGDCTIDGALSMTARGAYAPGELFAPNNLDNIITYNGYKDYSVGISGGSGGGRVAPNNTSLPGKPGSEGTNGAGGGGGSGAASDTGGGGRYAQSGAGAAGTTWSGGSGGGGADSGNGDQIAQDGYANGGPGGYARASSSGVSRCAGGGAGNNGGSGSSDGCTGRVGSNGTGGLLILIVRGKLTVSPTGSIVSKGSNGGSGNTYGGCSGGGGVTILYGDSYSNNGIVSTAGGSYGNGGAGGAGSLRIERIKAIELPRAFRPIVIDALGQTSELPKYHKMDASIGVWFGDEPFESDRYPFYYNLNTNQLYFFADENGDGVGEYRLITPPDINKMDKAVYDENNRNEPIAFESDLHFHEDLDLINSITPGLVATIHSHNNFTQLESLTEERMDTLDKLGEYEDQPTWNNLAWPVGNPASVGAALWISDTPPADPQNFPFWWNTAELQLYVYHVDGDSSQYVEANPVRHGKDGVDGLDGLNGRDGVNGLSGKDGADGLDGANRLWVGSEIPVNPVSYPFWWNPIEGRFLIWYETDSCYVEANPVVHGVDGQDGINGTNGADGKDGADGLNGLDGDNKIWVGTEIPTNPETYPFWWNPVEGRLLIWYITANAYVEANPVVHGIDGRDGIDGVDGAPGADGAPGGIQSFPIGYYIRKAELLVDTRGYSTNTTWKLGPAWSPVYDLLPNSKVWFSIKVPAKNNSTSWGGMFLELQIRFNSGDWYSLGCTGYDTVMEYGQSSHSYNCDYLVQGPDVPFSVEIRTYFKSYDGTTLIVDSLSINSVSGTAPLIEPAIYSLQHYSKLIVKELALFPIV